MKTAKETKQFNEEMKRVYKILREIMTHKKLAFFSYDEWLRLLKHIKKIYKLILEYLGIKTNFILNYSINEENSYSQDRLIIMSVASDIRTLRAKVNLDSLKIMQQDLIDSEKYDIDNFITDYIFASTRHEIEHFRQNIKYVSCSLEYDNYMFTLEEELLRKKIYNPNYLLKFKEVMASYVGDNFAYDFLKSFRKNDYLATTELIYTNFIYSYYQIYCVNGMPKSQFLIKKLVNIGNNEEITSKILRSIYDAYNNDNLEELIIELLDREEVHIIYNVFQADYEKFFQAIDNLDYVTKRIILNKLLDYANKSNETYQEKYNALDNLCHYPNFSFAYFEYFDLKLDLETVRHDYKIVSKSINKEIMLLNNKLKETRKNAYLSRTRASI